MSSSDYGQTVRQEHVVRQSVNESQVFKYCVCVDSTDTVFVYYSLSLFSAFAKLRKAASNFVMSVPLSVPTEQLGSHRTDFHEIWYLSIFRKSVEEVQISLKSYNNNGYFTWDQYAILITHRSILLRIWNFSDKKCRENQNTHFMFNKVFSKTVPFMR